MGTSRVESKNIRAVETAKAKKQTSQQGNYTIKSGDSVYKLSRAFNFKSEKEFRDYIHISGTAQLQKDAKITLPTVKLETTISAIARKYNCSTATILALNPQIKDPTRVQKGAVIYVPVRPFGTPDKKPAEKSAPPTPAKNNNSPTVKPEAPKVQAKPVTSPPPAAAGNSNDTARAIAQELKSAGSAWTWNSLDGKKFKKALAKINTKNVADVITEYGKISPDESLIEMICSEMTSGKDARKNAVMQIYDMLSEFAGEEAAPSYVRTAFKEELDKEFDKTFGFVSTKNLDKIINSLVNKEFPSGVVKNNLNTQVVVNGEKSGFTVASLHDDWKKTAKTWNRPAERPLPNVDGMGNIVAEVQVYDPTGKGPLKGKTIIVNPGHGGAMCNSDNSLNFDPGTSNAYIVKKKVKGRTVEVEHKSKFHGNGGKALEEWTLCREFADELTSKLTAAGAKVIYVSGSAYVVPETIEKYRKKADMVISLHADSANDKDGVTIIPTTSKAKNPIPDMEDAAFAEILNQNISSDSRFTGRTKIKTQPLAVLRNTDGKAYNGPDILIETGNLKNDKDVANLTNKNYRSALIDGIHKSVVECLSPDNKKENAAASSSDSYNRKFVSVKANNPHLVTSGENLSSIAEKYGVQVMAIKALNNMTSDSLSVGQVLKIPSTISAKAVSSLSDVADATGLSLRYINGLKQVEDDASLGQSEFHKKAYKDKNGNWTIGVGHLIKSGEMGKYKNTTLSKSEVCTLLAQDLLDRIENIKVIIGADTYNNLPQPMKDAVMDFTFSRGESTIKNHPGFVDALKKGDYEKAISLMNIDYSVVKDKKGKSKKVYLTGMVKRRLFEIHEACRMYKGKIPESIKDTIQNLYNRGLTHMKNEFKDSKQRENIKVGYNAYVEELFGDIVDLK